METAMEHLQGPLRKMIATAESPVSYRLPIGEVELPLNACLGKTMCLEYAGAITCIACGQRTKKSFNQGYCFRCVRTLAQCDLCIVKPELCHFAQGTCREPAPVRFRPVGSIKAPRKPCCVFACPPVVRRDWSKSR
jgi:hypothetical protein